MSVLTKFWSTKLALWFIGCRHIRTFFSIVILTRVCLVTPLTKKHCEIGGIISHCVVKLPQDKVMMRNS